MQLTEPSAMPLDHGIMLDRIFLPRTRGIYNVVGREKAMRSLMANLIGDGEIVVRRDIIPFKTVQIGGRRMRKLIGHYDEPDVLAFHECKSRRGRPDLKEQSWAAYRALRKEAGAAVVRRAEGAVLCWLIPTSRAALQAGNAEYFATARMIVSNSITSLGFLDTPADWRDWEDEKPVRKWLRARLSFSPLALTEIAEMVTAYGP